MIKNDTQLKVTQHWIGEFQKSVTQLEELIKTQENSLVIYKAILGSQKSQLETLKSEVKEYQDNKGA